MKNILSNLQTTPGIPLEKDELYRADLSDAYKRLAKLNDELRNEEYAIQKLHRLDADSRGVETAYIGRVDLIKIIEDLLANKSQVSKAFERHEVNKGKCAGWARRTIKYSIDKPELGSALDALANNTDLMLMQKYKVLDVKDIQRSASYSAALTKLKKQLHFAEQLQEKDNQLTLKDQAIAQGQQEIKRLQEELVRNKSGDWKENAIRLARAGNTVTNIRKLLGLSRGTVSTHLNKPEVKLLISQQKPSV